MNDQITQLNTVIIDSLEDNKAVNITPLNVSGLTDIMDSMIIATATSSRHAKSLGDKVLRAARDIGIHALSTDGDNDSEWVLIDFGDIVVHIMLKNTREFYDLEKLWSKTSSIRQEQAE